jgi:hypothetical protein
MRDERTSAESLYTPNSGLAAAIVEGTATSDNLSSVMKNAVVIFQSTLTIQIAPKPEAPTSEEGDV